MKHKIMKSLRMRLVCYSVFSLMLAIITETGIGVLLYLVSTLMGSSHDGYGYSYYNDTRGMMLNVKPKSSGTLYVIFRRLSHMEKSTLITFLAVSIVFGFFLFVLYFMLMTRNMTQDLTYISSQITSIAKGNVLDPLLVTREDEIGEIALRINEMNEEVKRLMQAERDALQTNKDLITCVAHDLRTPLTSVIGYIQLAMDTDKYDVTERQKFARIASQKANRLEGLIQDLFSYTKLMSGEISLHPCEIDLVKLVEQMDEEFYPLFEDNHLTCQMSHNVDSMLLSVDPELIARAMQNLIGNAVKYGKDGKQILIAVDQVGEEAQIRVTNYGLIIPKDSLNLIFEKFYRVEESRSRQTGGTGLGLNIAKEIIEMHGGTICVDSGMSGTTFTLALPYPKQNKGQVQEQD